MRSRSPPFAPPTDEVHNDDKTTTTPKPRKTVRIMGAMLLLVSLWLVMFPVEKNVKGTTTNTTIQKKTNQNTPNNENALSAVDPQSVPACTFQDILQFHKTQSPTTHNDNNNENDDDQWSLEKEIVRVPATAILNRDNLPLLGSCGIMGLVYRAILQLPDGTNNNNSHKVCAAAIKTDKCYTLKDSRSALHFTPGEKMCDANGDNCHCVKENAGSCLARNAGWNFVSHMASEYLGALPWYYHYHHAKSQQQQPPRQGTLDPHNNNVLDIREYGLLPTWAIVQAPDRPLRKWIPQSWIKQVIQHKNKKKKDGTSHFPPPHPDPSVVGVLMPLVKFTPLDNWKATAKNRWSAAELAQLLLPATRGLVLLHRMGLVHGDVLSKNIGIVVGGASTNESYSFLYDSSTMARRSAFVCQNNTTTTNAMEQEPCHYAFEKAFPVSRSGPPRKQHTRGNHTLSVQHNNNDARQTDVAHLKGILSGLFRDAVVRPESTTTITREWMARLEKCRDAREIEQLLRDMTIMTTSNATNATRNNVTQTEPKNSPS